MIAFLLAEGIIALSTGTSPLAQPLGRALALMAAGVAGLGVGFVALRRLLSAERPLLAVARHLLTETLRSRGGVAWGVVLVAVVAFLPLTHDPEAPHGDRVQSLLSHGSAAVVVLLSLFTLLLACGSLTGELEEGEIRSVLVKPIPRSTYWIGKLLGIWLTNLVLLVVAAATLAGTIALLASGADSEEGSRVEKEVLVARRSFSPVPPEPWEDYLAERLLEIRRTDPERVRDWGERRVLEEERRSMEKVWLSIPPGESRRYVFEGVPATGDAQLRFRVTVPRLSRQEEVALLVQIDGERFPVTVALSEYRSLPLSLDARRDGRVDVRIENPVPEPGALTATGRVRFPPEDLEVLVPVGGFVANLVRSFAIIWIQLGFLAALGLWSSISLGFPVACLLGLIFLLGATSSGFLLEEPVGHAHGRPHEHESHEEPRPPLVLELLDAAGRNLARGLQSYVRFDSRRELVEGRWVPWSRVADCWWRLGLVGTGALTLLAHVNLARREIARVQV